MSGYLDRAGRPFTRDAEPGGGVFAHGGDVRAFERLYGGEPELDFSSNVNPLGPSPKALEAAREALGQAGAYPDPQARRLVDAICAHEEVGAEQVVCGAGASDVILRLALALRPQQALIPVPTFSEYAQALALVGCQVQTWRLDAQKDFALDEGFVEAIRPGIDLVVVCNPNNPTARLAPPRLLDQALAACERVGAHLLADECFLDFLPDGAAFDLGAQLGGHRLLIVLKALTKLYGLAGLRAGYALVGDRELATAMRASGSPWPLSCVAEAAGMAALGDQAHVVRARTLVAEERPKLARGLEALGCQVVPGQANFILAHADEPDICRHLARRGVLVRDCANFEGLGPGWFRVAVRSGDENGRLLEILAQALADPPEALAAPAEGGPSAGATEPASATSATELAAATDATKPAVQSLAEKASAGVSLQPRRARAIMVQGTMSNVGKSLICAGLCRCLVRRGLSVAPFKSQNMALNSGVTAEGLEMGRAQILQAQAAGVEPSALMNPILLKPTGETGSQVIVGGEPIGHMTAREYGAFRPQLTDKVKAAFDELAASHDAIVIEGAGSPVEINLGRDDFVNMGMARLAQAPVILVGDIDPGGVFAQLSGTMSLLSSQERAMVGGIVVNKFRGDPAILEPGLAQLESLCGAPVLGVVPYLGLDLDEEDSLAARLGVHGKADPALVDVAVIRLPRLANFTDLDGLARHPRVSVRYVNRPQDLGRPDLVVLPGTKATLDDLRWLRRTGLADCICALVGQGTPALGICGGFQMLGRTLEDPVGEDGGGSERGLGLLPVATVFGAQKTRTRICARIRAGQGVFASLAGLELEGYEIHMGKTGLLDGARPALDLFDADNTGAGRTQGRPDGCVCDDVLGTYVHGLLDAPGAVDALVGALLERRGLLAQTAEGVPVSDARQAREAQLDRLADALEASLDMNAVCELLERGLDEQGAAAKVQVRRPARDDRPNQARGAAL